LAVGRVRWAYRVDFEQLLGVVQHEKIHALHAQPLQRRADLILQDPRRQRIFKTWVAAGEKKKQQQQKK
jgi:hypothetical protein